MTERGNNKITDRQTGDGSRITGSTILSNETQNKSNGNERQVNKEQSQYDVAEIMGGLYGDGFIGLKAGFSREWIQQLHEDILLLYGDALKRPGGAVGRGPNRHYVEIHPEDLRGFLELATHPWITS